MNPSGVIQIQANQLTVQVSGLGLSTPPPYPALTLVAPAGYPGSIFAFVIGATTMDGFTIGLSAPPIVSGYSVKWELPDTASVNSPTQNMVNVAVGQLLIPITGLGLIEAPPLPAFTLSIPAGGGSIVPFLAGPSTTDGFVIALSAPPSVTGYVLQWSFESTQPAQAPPGTAPAPLLPFDWKDRGTLISGRKAINGNSFYLSIDPYGQTFLVYPEIDDNHTITLNWDGVRNTFAPTDAVPFDEECAGAVAEWVTAWMAKGRNDWSTWGAAMKPGIGSYNVKKRNLLLNSRNRTQMRDA